jgi:GNAT superfamily N-acetyltransferase
MDIGAAWWRLFPEHDRGYGFVDDKTPELSIGVVHEARRRGVGTLLLRSLIEEAQRSGLPALSLSVERDNPAVSRDERLGFEPVRHGGGSLTMVLSTRN